MTPSLEIVSVVGARPQFVKLAPIARALDAVEGVRHRIVHTGQHYDERMSSVFFDQLRLPPPEINLGVGSASHGAQTAAMLAGLEERFLRHRPAAVLVYGDTNSTLAATLAATKLHLPVAHVESGLRSFDRDMPEELNRVATDHLSDRLYAPTPLAMENLSREGLAGRAVLSGDVMRDAALAHHRTAMETSRALEELELEGADFALLTLHRPANTTAEALGELLGELAALIGERMRLLFPIHPRTLAVLGPAAGRLPPAIRVVEPLAYLDLLRVLAAARLVVTDSGGLQKEAAFLGTPCITVREETEWVETVQMGVNRLTGRDPERLRVAFEAFAGGADPFAGEVAREMDRQYGTGEAARRLCDDLLAWLAAGGRGA